jgi:hypothetical protein
MTTTHLYRLHYAPWEDLPPDYRAEVFPDDWAEDFYRHYFYWYGTLHEMGHILRWHYGTASDNPWVEESAVMDFAGAYWRARGERARLDRFAALVRRSLTMLDNPVPEGEEPSAYYQQHYNDPMPVLVYAYFQDQLALAAIEKDLNLLTALSMLITPTATRAQPARVEPYLDLDSDLPERIVADMRPFLVAYGVDVPPVQIVRKFTPGLQYVSCDEP